MSYPLRLANRLADRAHRRLRRSRAGSILIMVIALLVLMALIGTAFITTTQSDRYSATTNGYNTQIDLLAASVAELSKNILVSDLVGSTGTFRPDGDTVYDHMDAARADTGPGRRDRYLATRLPLVVTDETGNTTPPFWHYISEPPVAASGARSFESPDGVEFDNYKFIFPGGRTYTLSSGRQVTVPIISYNGGPAAGVIGADTDGDGIADAAFFKLPVGQVNGVSYYAAIRYIDNGSAVNVNVARGPNTAGTLANFFPSNVDLQGLLFGGATELQRLHGYSLSGNVTATSPLTATGAMSRTDFQFVNNLQGSYEALYTLLGSRLGNPYRQTSGTQSYFPLSLGNQMALTARFCLANPYAASSDLEQVLPDSTALGPVARVPFLATDVTTWYNSIFNYGDFQFGGTGNVTLTSPAPRPRPLLVTHNAVSTFVPSRYRDKGPHGGGGYLFGDRVTLNGRAFVCLQDGATSTPTLNVPLDTSAPNNAQAEWGLQPWTTHPTRISVNTGTFGQLWPAYWAVMKRAEDLLGPTAVAEKRQFRPPGHERGAGSSNAPLLDVYNMRKLRAALAAVSTMDLRDPDDNITSRRIKLSDQTGNPIWVSVFGSERQPYITEAVVHTYNATSGTGPYIAFELYNPHSVPIYLKNLTLARCDRNSTLAMTHLKDLKDVTGLQDLLGAGERLLIENDSSRRPADLVPLVTPSGALVQTVAVAELDDLLLGGGVRELYLLRTRDYRDYSNPTDPALHPPLRRKSLNREDPYNVYDETVGDNDLVPLDQLDFEGIFDPYVDVRHPTDPPTDHRFHYARANNPAGGTAWHCVYPYPSGQPLAGNTTLFDYRTPSPHNVTATDAQGKWAYAGWLEDPPLASDPTQRDLRKVYFGKPKGLFAGPVTWGTATAPPTATYATRAIQVAGRDAAGPNSPAYNTGTPAFPYGAFGRNGDIMQVMFCGGYTIRDTDTAGAAFMEMNSITVDTMFAEDGDPTDDAFENIGRFCPLYRPGTGSTDDFNANATDARYSFALDLFDYLDVRSPQDDYLPNIDPGDDYQAQPRWLATLPDAVNNETPGATPAQSNKGLEDGVGEHGKISINTAGWRVLATLPMITDNAGAIIPAANARLAQNIVYYRDFNDGSGSPHGPFRNIFELQKVPSFPGSIHGLNTFATGDPDDMDGDLSPYNGGTSPPAGSNELDPRDLVFNDFETTYLAITRISNLITTRSDSFTVYVLVQGWKNAGNPTNSTTPPELVVQRRLAYIADRTKVKPILSTTNGTASTARTGMDVTNVPNN